MSTERKRWGVRWVILAVGPVLAAWSFWSIVSEQYSAGLRFERGLHVFGLFQAVPKAWINCTLAVLITLLALLNRRPVEKELRRVVSLAAGFCVLCGVLSIVLYSYSFRSGRDEAYQRLDFGGLAAACEELRGVEGNANQPARLAYWYIETAEYARLPVEIRKLSPKTVIAGDGGVILWMDGGGPAPHEGVFFPAAEPAKKQVNMMQGIEKLSEEPLAYRFELYDCRTLLD